MTELLQLPNEVLDMISDCLGAQDLGALRLTSKRLNAASLPSFSRGYFKTRYVMFSRLSLQNLIEIAQHPVFGPSVRTLEICLDRFVQNLDHRFCPAKHEADEIVAMEEDRPQTLVKMGSIFGARSSDEDGRRTDERNVSSQDSDEASVDRAAYMFLWEEQEHEIMPELAQAYITRALIALTNVKVIIISNTHRPWGALAHNRQTGIPLTNALGDSDEWPFVGQVVDVVLTAIVTSGAAIGRLAITAGDNKEAITPDILRLTRAHLQYYGDLPSSLTELVLYISDEGSRNSEHEWVHDLSGFIGVFRQLTYLGVVIRPHHSQFSSHMYRLKGLGTKFQVPNLQHLVLEKVYCSTEDLAAVILRHKATLQSFTLAQVVVSDGIERLRALFALIRAHIARLKLSIYVLFSGCQLIMYPECKDERPELCFDVGGSHEDWTTAIHAIKLC
ncbi:hypothetical protein F5Y04DRAFT_249266 [Hypomontagnella monticulosa]|nr:hypothetical protein F5Y04DRAFT_249266 [Hypomontagnella monticulosa]